MSSNAQTDLWQAQDKDYRRLYAATTHEDFLKASTAVAGGGVGAAKTTVGKATLILSSRVLNPHLGLMDMLENHALLMYQVGSFSMVGLLTGSCGGWRADNRVRVGAGYVNF